MGSHYFIILRGSLRVLADSESGVQKEVSSVVASSVAVERPTLRLVVRYIA